MKQGRTIFDLAEELERQRRNRKDFVADTRKLAVKTKEGQSLLQVVLPEGAEEFVVSELMHRQLGERLQIPQKYYQKMRGEDPELLDYNINRWFTQQPASRMVRTLDGKARAFLSDRYRRLDNLELADVVFPFIKDMKGADLASCEVTESHMFIKVINKRLHYAVDPQSVLYALHGSAVHTMHEQHTDGNMLSEIRLKDAITSGKFDLYGQILDKDEGVLGDLKVTSSYTIMKALGRYKVDVPTGQHYVSGQKKGQMKYRKEWRDDGVRGVGDWAIQLNYYRILLEQQGLAVNRMVIQALCRDSSLRMAAERGIDQAVYLIPIRRISDSWILRYMQKKSQNLQKALAEKRLPPRCSSKERWHDRKCKDYCQVAEHCPYGKVLKITASEAKQERSPA